MSADRGERVPLAHSYNSYIDEPLRGIKVYANYREQKTDGTTKVLPYAAAAKFDFEGKFLNSDFRILAQSRQTNLFLRVPSAGLMKCQLINCSHENTDE